MIKKISLQFFAVIFFLFCSVIVIGLMHNIDDLLEQNTTVLSESSEPSFIPSPTEEIKVNPEPKNIVQQQVFIPTPTLDPDPIITCNSKTGKIQVRKSVCFSYTDCPDGYGGFVFESQSSCKERWIKISNNLNNAVKNYTNSSIEYQQAYHKYLNSLNQQNPLPTIDTYVPIPSYKTDLDFKVVSEPTPTQSIPAFPPGN